MSKLAYQINENSEDTGARRLQAVVETVCEDVSFNAPDYEGTEYVIGADYVRNKLKNCCQHVDLHRHLI